MKQRFYLYTLSAMILVLGLVLKAKAGPSKVTEIQIGQFKNLTEAVPFAKEASEKLVYPIVENTFREPATKIRYVGRVIEIHKEKSGLLVVSAFLGSVDSGAQEINYYFQQIQGHFPQAIKKEIQKEIGDLEFDQFFAAHAVSNVIILGSYKTFKGAREKADWIAQKTGIPYDTRGMIYDSQKGLIWPKDDPENPFAGEYLARGRYECSKSEYCITIERSDHYEGFSPGYYIVVGGIYFSETEAEERNQLLTKYKKHIPDAYSKKTSIYMGCRS